MNRSQSIALVIAVTVTAARAAIEWFLHGRNSISAAGVFCLVVAGGALAYGLWMAVRVTRAERQRPVTPPAAVWWIWVGCLLIGILVWPFAFDPNTFAVAALCFFGTLVCFPSAVADEMRLESGRERGGIAGIRTAVMIGLLVAVIATINYLRVAYRSIGSVDFFYYICTARDMLARDVPVSDNCYGYFPGVYAFWRAVMRIVGDSLVDLQLSYLWLLVLNAVLIGVLTSQATRSRIATLLAAVWYMVLVSRFEGLAGVSEPLATAAVLSGLLIWGGRPLVGRRGLIVAVLFGAMMGLTVYTKQQAGLLTLGAAALLVCRPAMSTARRHAWAALAVIPLVAVVVFLGVILLEGRGWIPLTRGLTMATNYGREGSLLRNLYTQIRGDESAALAAGFMVLAWCGMLWRGDREKWCACNAFQLASFAVIAFLAALVPFISRPFGHYMLLAIPWLIIGAVSLGSLLWQLLPARLTQSKLFLSLTIAGVAVLFANTSGRTDTLYVWRLRLPAGFQAKSVWHEQPAQQADLEVLRTVVAPGSRMYVFPPRRNAIYFLLGTRTANPSGYRFHRPDAETMPWEQCDSVLLLTRGLNEYDRQLCPPAEFDRLRDLLRKRGFQRRLADQLHAMELYENPSPKK